MAIVAETEDHVPETLCLDTGGDTSALPRGVSIASVFASVSCDGHPRFPEFPATDSAASIVDSLVFHRNGRPPTTGPRHLRGKFETSRGTESPSSNSEEERFHQQHVCKGNSTTRRPCAYLDVVSKGPLRRRRQGVLGQSALVRLTGDRHRVDVVVVRHLVERDQQNGGIQGSVFQLK